MQTLYESSIAFGMRKALQTEQGKGDMEGRIGTLEAETKDFERQVCQILSIMPITMCLNPLQSMLSILMGFCIVWRTAAC